MSGQYPTQDLAVQILGVQPGFTRNNKQKFDVQCSDGQTYTTFRPEAASKAQALVGQPGVIVRISINGNYKNFEDAFQGGAPSAAQYSAPPVAPQAQFTPAPGFQAAPDAKDIRISRGNAINAAASSLSALIGTGVWLDDDGNLDADAVAEAVISVARGLAPYIIEGPGGGAAAPAAQAPALPPGVTPEQVAAWAAAQGAEGVAVGAPVPSPAPAEEAKPAY